jgi:hypothetical protein
MTKKEPMKSLVVVKLQNILVFGKTEARFKLVISANLTYLSGDGL